MFPSARTVMLPLSYRCVTGVLRMPVLGETRPPLTRPVGGSDTETSTILRPAVTLTLPPALRMPCWKLLYWIHQDVWLAILEPDGANTPAPVKLTWLALFTELIGVRP